MSETTPSFTLSLKQLAAAGMVALSMLGTFSKLLYDAVDERLDKIEAKIDRFDERLDALSREVSVQAVKTEQAVRKVEELEAVAEEFAVVPAPEPVRKSRRRATASRSFTRASEPPEVRAINPVPVTVLTRKAQEGSTQKALRVHRTERSGTRGSLRSKSAILARTQLREAKRTADRRWRRSKI